MTTRPPSWKCRRRRQLSDCLEKMAEPGWAEWDCGTVGLGCEVPGLCCNRPPAHKVRSSVGSWQVLLRAQTCQEVPGLHCDKMSKDVPRCHTMLQAPLKNTLCYSLLASLHLPLVLTKYLCNGSVHSAADSVECEGMMMSLGSGQSSIKMQVRGSSSIHQSQVKKEQPCMKLCDWARHA